MLVLRRIVGQSMAPLLLPGNIVIATFWPKGYRKDDIVIIKHNGIEKIKRIKHIKHNQIFVIGDNAAKSTDSRQFGWLPASAVIAQVIYPKSQLKRRFTS